ncbi:hypothetical protein BB560_006649 [Smittium megazygosporum]|uniref:Calpain catalytic domain-containing protein n=1 Tax=Smittium megazygosporum TaxID=133381 RepID=A0A2T9Y2N0_9FUNG|nr:hypothetical protein BB560_006649 [Smittium megazygosporum]
MEDSLLKIYRKVQKQIEALASYQSQKDTLQALKALHLIVTGFQSAAAKETGLSQKISLERKIKEYSAFRRTTFKSLSENDIDLISVCENLILSAKREEESGKFDLALDDYLSALDFLEILLIETKTNSQLKTITNMIKGALFSAENLKKQISEKPLKEITNTLSSVSITKTPQDICHRKLPDDELSVIMNTSYVNGLVVLPWDIKDSICYSESEKSFHDPDGKIKLSELQENSFGSWQRVSSVFKDNLVFFPRCSTNIVQDIVTDCSVVVSLIVCIENVNRFDKPVEIDDYVPVSLSGKLMCTYSTDNSLWVPLVEKAIKDQTWNRILDGFTSGNLLVTIATGEIGRPDRESLGLVSSHAYAVLDIIELDGTRLLKVKNPWSHVSWKGTCSIFDDNFWSKDTSKTLDFKSCKADSEIGIFWIDFNSVLKHFEAIHLNWDPHLFLFNDVIHFQWKFDSSSDGLKKNESLDISNSPQFCLAVKNRSRKTNVWVLLSKHSSTIESNNDYLALHVYKNENSLVRKNSIDLSPRDENSDLMNLNRFRILEASQPYVTTDYINSSRLLLRFEVQENDSGVYSIVASQRNQIQDLNFSLFVFSESEFELNKIPEYSYSECINSSWTNNLAGGNSASPEYLNNPQFSLVISDNLASPSDLCGYVSLTTSYKFPIQIRIFKSGYLISTVSSVNTVSHSGNYRTYYCTAKLDGSQEQAYTILVSTFEPLMFGPFKLSVKLNKKFSLNILSREGAGMRHKVIMGECYSVNVSFPTIITARIYTTGDTPKQSVNLSLFIANENEEPVGHPAVSTGPYIDSPQGAVINKTLLKPQKYGYIMYPSIWENDISCKYTIDFYSEFPVEIESRSIE